LLSWSERMTLLMSRTSSIVCWYKEGIKLGCRRNSTSRCRALGRAPTRDCWRCASRFCTRSPLPALSPPRAGDRRVAPPRAAGPLPRVQRAVHRTHTGTHHRLESGGFGTHGGFLVLRARLHPDDLRADRNRIVNDRGYFFGTPKDLDHVAMFGDVSQALVRMLAQCV